MSLKIRSHHDVITKHDARRSKSGWSCDIAKIGKCYSGITGPHQTANIEGWTCEKDNWDICKKCLQVELLAMQIKGYSYYVDGGNTSTVTRTVTKTIGGEGGYDISGAGIAGIAGIGGQVEFDTNISNNRQQNIIRKETRTIGAESGSTSFGIGGELGFNMGGSGVEMSNNASVVRETHTLGGEGNDFGIGGEGGFNMVRVGGDTSTLREVTHGGKGSTITRVVTRTVEGDAGGNFTMGGEGGYSIGGGMEMGGDITRHVTTTNYGPGGKVTMTTYNEGGDIQDMIRKATESGYTMAAS